MNVSVKRVKACPCGSELPPDRIDPYCTPCRQEYMRAWRARGRVRRLTRKIEEHVAELRRSIW